MRVCGNSAIPALVVPLPVGKEVEGDCNVFIQMALLGDEGEDGRFGGGIVNIM